MWDAGTITPILLESMKKIRVFAVLAALLTFIGLYYYMK